MLQARTGPARARAAVKIGPRYPLAPPVGRIYLFWGTDAELNPWLAKEPTLPARLDRARLRRVVAECRQRGYLAADLAARKNHRRRARRGR